MGLKEATQHEGRHVLGLLRGRGRQQRRQEGVALPAEVGDILRRRWAASSWRHGESIGINSEAMGINKGSLFGALGCRSTSQPLERSGEVRARMACRSRH